MFSRLANVLQELSGEEGQDGDTQQGEFMPQPPAEEGQAAPAEPEAPEEAIERLAHLEQLVVQLKELIRDKDTQLVQKDTELASKDVLLKNEREAGDARFSKLKLQAKAKMVALNKQIADLKGQEGAISPDSSFSRDVAGESDVQELQSKLGEEEAKSNKLREQLQDTEKLLAEKDVAHAQQMKLLQAVICEKDVRFQDQVQKHEEELLAASIQSSDGGELQQALHAAQRRCEELEESLKSRSQVLEMLQQEVSSADQQKQILTVQFRQMEVELDEAVKLREQQRQEWTRQSSKADVDLQELLKQEKAEAAARHESELASLREASNMSLEKEKAEVARLEAEMALMKEAVQACQEASEREMEIIRLEKELTSSREAESDVIQASQKSLEETILQVDKLERERAFLQGEWEEAQKKSEIFAEVWKHLQPLIHEEVQPLEDITDLSMVVDTVLSIETQVSRLKDERRESEQRCSELTHSLVALQEQLDRSASEEKEARIQQLEQPNDPAPEMVSQETQAEASSEAEKVTILSLEQQLLEKDNQLIALKESFRLAQECSTSDVSTTENIIESKDDVTENNVATPPDSLEDTQEEETTLVAEDTSILSISADNESSQEFVEHHDSPEESKGTPSDEMVTSNSSWTLLEAVNQDGRQEWPSIMQDFGHMQSWETTSMEQETSTTLVTSSSVIIRETVEVHETRDGASTTDAPSGHVFAQALTEELQKRYTELLTELKILREATAESQEKIRSLEEKTQKLTADKEEVQSQASVFAEELKCAREEVISVSQQSNAEIALLKEQMDILSNDCNAKEQKIQALQADVEVARQALSEQQSQAHMLGSQLEERELLSSELEKKLQDIESNMLKQSQKSALDDDSLSKKDSEICELQFLLNQEQRQMTELNDSMSAKLNQAEEEKLLVNSEVNKLREQLVELQKSREETSSQVDEELSSLRKAKEDLETQLVSTRKKLQVVLVQRKDLMKKVSDMEMEVNSSTEKEEVSETAANIQDVEKFSAKDLEAKLLDLEQAVKSKDQVIECLECKISQQAQLLAETCNKQAESPHESCTLSDNSMLQSQVASLEAECETLQRKVLEAKESRKESIRKAKEKDRHHRDQLKQQKEEYGELMERFEGQSGDCELLLNKLRDLEDKNNAQNNAQKEEQPAQESKNLVTNLEKGAANDWVQEDWVDFAGSESDSAQPLSGDQQPSEQPKVMSPQTEVTLKALREEIQIVRMENSELENKLQEAQTTLSQKEADLQDVSKELRALCEKERQIEVLSEEINALREKYQQAESCAEALKTEMETVATEASSQSASQITALQAEVEDFKNFLDDKNTELATLSQQIHEQKALIHSMQDTVDHKDQLIASLEAELKAEQEKSKKVEVEEEKDNEAKIQQLQRKLQAALVSRKEMLKENKTQKEQLASSETFIADLQQKMQVAEDELEKLRAERTKLIDEVDRMLQENQSLGSSCESLKLAMETIASEKDTYVRESELAKDEAAKMCSEWEEKVSSMKEEYETLLHSYENVSDEAERVRRVLEAARQERKELAAKVRSNDAARQEAERQAEDAQKEVESVKDKMRKFVKAKQQKILELEEETERLREGKEKRQLEGGNQTKEFERHQDELQTLKAELDATVTERDDLAQEVEQLKERLGQIDRKDTDPVCAAKVVEQLQHSDHIVTQMEIIESKETYTHVDSPDDRLSSKLTPNAEPLEEQKVTLEGKIREMEAALQSERELWKKQEAELRVGLASLEQDLQESNEKASLMTSLENCLHESKERESCLIEESSKQEAQFKDLLKNLESEKDNLEERLMNQLAQLNGSIAGYQQEAADNRELLTELRQEVERLERERCDLEAEVRAQTDRATRLEEDMRQAQRQRAEAEAETGKQRELEQQLRSAQRIREGSQSRARQLEELLREKQLEVRQLQKDSIQYQERISELGREVKALQLGHSELSKNLEQSQEEISKTKDDLKRSEAELASCKSDLSEAKEQFKRVTLEKTSLEQSVQQKESLLKAEAEQTLDSVRFRLGAELKEMELRLEEAYNDREKEEEATLEAKEAAVAADRQAKENQARLDESLARLAAFSRCMSSLQDDRDRVLDEARQWETRFNNALHGKEAEVRNAETRAKELADILQKESSLKAEIQLSVDRLQKANEESQLKLEKTEKNLNESRAEVEKQRAELLQTTAELQSAESQAQLLREELDSHNQRASAFEEAVAKLQEEVGRARIELRERETDERRLCLTLEQFEADLHASKALTESLQAELREKEQREVEMLDEKEQAIVLASEEARKEGDGRAREAEEELEKRRGELRDVEENLRRAKEERDTCRAKLDSFTKAMGSLQDDRDRVLNMYKQLEEKHLQIMMDKDGLIQEAASESNGLKEELRSLLVQRDDLYAEKGKLSAQLHGYRDELQQVLSMKDSQHKQLVAAQRERISSLEKERDNLESTLRNIGKVEAAKKEQEMPLQAVNAPGAEVEKLKEQLLVAREQAQALEEKLLEERQEHKTNTKELSELRWEGGVMRTESESAQERVAELASDLLAVEQKLREEKEAVTQLRAENQSFGKAMASLQDSRDQAEKKARELSFKLEEVRKAGSPVGSAGEVWSLKNALQALQNDRERLLEQLQTQTLELQTHKSELARLGAGELIKVSQALFEEKNKNQDMVGVIKQLENMAEVDKQEIEMLRLERVDWLAQAEQLKQQTLSALSERDQQLRQLAAMLEEARAHTPKLQKELYQREASQEVDSAPGAPQERLSRQDVHASPSDISEMQQRLEEETQQRLAAEEQLIEAQDRLRRQAKREDHSDTTVLIEPPEGSVSRTRRGGTGLLRALRAGVCWRRRTPLLLSIYLLSVHVLLLLCVGGFL
ncbi:golgin subfamily B member 1 [Nerophis lumbriciformis]|uniref:golgin subfamily B member 1 n=1 Tax=Nerophis lumbriciformis TaxID=546530 RepID=UPI002ADFC41A|nr:golgin subfamily B member 1-like [Nerophis lumbriciformis]